MQHRVAHWQLNSVGYERLPDPALSDRRGTPGLKMREAGSLRLGARTMREELRPAALSDFEVTKTQPLAPAKARTNDPADPADPPQAKWPEGRSFRFDTQPGNDRFAHCGHASRTIECRGSTSSGIGDGLGDFRRKAFLTGRGLGRLLHRLDLLFHWPRRRQ